MNLVNLYVWFGLINTTAIYSCCNNETITQNQISYAGEGRYMKTNRNKKNKTYKIFQTNTSIIRRKSC